MIDRPYPFEISVERAVEKFKSRQEIDVSMIIITCNLYDI